MSSIRVHQLVLPETPGPETNLSPPSPVQPSIIRRPSNRRHPSSTHLHHIRERSTSASSSTGLGRTRAPTLAGQALEHAHEAVKAIQEQDVQSEVKERKLARTFLTLRLPVGKEVASKNMDSEEGQGFVLPPSRKGKERAVNGTTNGRPSFKTSSSQSSVDSVTSSASGRSTPTNDFDQNKTRKDIVRFGETAKQPERIRNDSQSSSGSVRLIVPNSSGPALTNGHSHNYSRRGERSEKETSVSIPIFISPIHHPSTNPRFLQLEEGDFAPWLTTEESASSQAVLEVWYEDSTVEEEKKNWRKADTIGGPIRLTDLRKLESGVKLGDNAILITLAMDPDSTYYIDTTSSHPTGKVDGSKARDAVERSRRETRMKKGIGLGGLHQ